jgi:predicted DNA-binding protein (MmcQ/YjbR family)
MAHPQMFDDADPLLAKVRKLAFALPSAAEKISHGHPVFFTKKVFAIYGGSLKINGQWVQYPQSLLVMVDEDEHRALSQDERFYVPAYWGPYGWVGLLLTKRTKWDEVEELLDGSYRLTATAKLIAQLDS